MRFLKAHGSGNDFVVLPDWNDDLELSPALVRALCDRRHGIGADGVLRIVAGDGDADAVMDHRNADGSVTEMCGNGIRVVAKHVLDHGLVTSADGRLRIGTRAGVREVEAVRGADGLVTHVDVDMGPATLVPDEIPFEAAGPEAVAEPVEVAGRTVEVTAVSMGNPHAVLVVDDVDTAPVAELGPALETHPRFPEHTNVEFVELGRDGDARVRVWERGVGETAACGSGACAVLVALQRLGRAGGDITLLFPGGGLEVRRHDVPGATVHLRGPAVEVAAGELDRGWLRALMHDDPARR